MKTKARYGALYAISACAALAAVCGCAGPSASSYSDLAASSDIPRELQKVTHPTYRVAPPDILLIEAVHNIRPAGDKLRAGDHLQIRLGNPEPLTPPAPNAGQIEQQIKAQYEAQAKFIDGDYTVQPDGSVDLGPIYDQFGKVKVEGLSVEQAKQAIINHLKTYTRDAAGNPAGIKDPQVSVAMPNIAGKQIITGEHLVRPDGTVSLGVYGSVHVAGMTLAEVKDAVETHLSLYIHNPEVSVDVGAYNSQVYYIVTDGGGFGEQVVRLPCTGNETVLDAVANIQGLSQISSKQIWIARPTPAGADCAQVLDVNWREITKEGITTTNYQLLPGDRIYIAADNMIALDNFISKVVAPVERVFGVILLGNGTVRSLEGRNTGTGGFGGGFF